MSEWSLRCLGKLRPQISRYNRSSLSKLILIDGVECIAGRHAGPALSRQSACSCPTLLSCCHATRPRSHCLLLHILNIVPLALTHLQAVKRSPVVSPIAFEPQNSTNKVQLSTHEEDSAGSTPGRRPLPISHKPAALHLDESKLSESSTDFNHAEGPEADGKSSSAFSHTLTSEFAVAGCCVIDSVI